MPHSSYSGRQLLVGYWGQNRAGPANGPPNYEKPLLEVCQTTKYDILAVSYVVVFFDPRNKGNIKFLKEPSISLPRELRNQSHLEVGPRQSNDTTSTMLNRLIDGNTFSSCVDLECRVAMKIMVMSALVI